MRMFIRIGLGVLLIISTVEIVAFYNGYRAPEGVPAFVAALGAIFIGAGPMLDYVETKDKKRLKTAIWWLIMAAMWFFVASLPLIYPLSH